MINLPFSLLSVINPLPLRQVLILCSQVITKALQRKQEKKKSVHIRFSCSDDDDDDDIEKKDSEK